MICPKCSAETRVVESRTNEAGAQIRRRRVCVAEACGHRFTTYESTFNVSKRRAAWRKKRSETRAKATPEQIAKRRERRRLMAKVYREARETGAPINAVCARWGIERQPIPVSRS